MNLPQIHFSANPFMFQLVGHLLIGAFSCWILLRKQPLPDALFLIGLVTMTAVMRLPTFFFNHQLDPDESQMLAQGLTLSIDPVVYRSVDPTTGGPLTSYLLAGLAKLGFTLDFQLAHILSWILTLAALIIGYFTAKFLNLSTTAQWAMLPFLSFISFVQSADFVMFYSEIISIIVLNITVLLLAYWQEERTISRGELLVFGLLLGIIPLCKLQALPMAFIVGMYACVQVSIFHSTDLIRRLLFLSLGFVISWLAWGIFLAQNHVLTDFYTYYIKANLAYKDNFATSGVPRSKFVNFFRLPWVIIHKNSGFEWLLYPFMLLLVAAISQIIAKKQAKKSVQLNTHFWVMLVLFLLMTNLAITRTGSFYEHYYNYLFLPFLLFFALCLHYLSTKARWVMMFTQLAFFTMFIVKTVQNKSTNLFTTTPRPVDIARTAIAKAILNYGNSGQYLAVWGWSCDLFVATQMPQGVNENHTVRSGMSHSYQEQYLKRYINDLEQNHPPIFIDAVTPSTIWMNDPKKYGHKNYPELAKFIADKYVFREEVAGVKIYSHK